MRGKYANDKRSFGSKGVALLLALVLLVGGIAVGGTIAWLIATSETVTNTFSVGNIEIELAEMTGTEYKVVPGGTDKKDPAVTVVEGSEKCYVYVSIQNNLVIDNKSVAKLDIKEADWIAIGTNGNTTLYRYKEIVDAAQGGQKLDVFENVTYAKEITKENIKSLDGKTIVIRAYAYQSDNVAMADADAAANTWAGTTAIPTT